MRSEHTLYIVATPIGHRDDFSPRAVETLQAVTRIYAEDTRHSLPLMRHHGISTRLHALHEHNETAEAARIVEYVQTHGSAALIVDAGTPLISDPGFRVVRACRAAGVSVSPVPGPCAVSAALSVGGLPTDRFQFVGFPPSRKVARRNWLGPLAATPHTLVFYESPHRIADTLADFVEIFGPDREMTIARELTKLHETLLQGSLAELLDRVLGDANQRRGEFVLMLAGTGWRGDADPLSRSEVTGELAAEPGADESTVSPGDATESKRLQLDRVLDVLAGKLPPREVARCAAELCGVSRGVAYDRALQRRAKGPSDA